MQKNDEDQGPTELLERPREYNVKFRFPETSKLQPPILGLYETDFNYPGQAPLFKKVDFGIDMESRIAIVGECYKAFSGYIRGDLLGYLTHDFLMMIRLRPTQTGSNQ